MREPQLIVAGQAAHAARVAQGELAALSEPRPLPAPLAREVPAGAVRSAKLAAHDGVPGEPRADIARRAVAGLVAVGGLALLFAPLGLRLVGLGAFVIGLAALAGLARRVAARLGERERRLAAAVAARPFPVRCYLIWLTADQPVFDLHLRGATDRAQAATALRAVSPAATLRWLDEGIARIELPPIEVGGGAGGDPALLRRFLDEVVAPLHREVGVSRLEMGGTVVRG
jgi:hypothetical protein